jgi:hypothetical protein
MAETRTWHKNIIISSKQQGLAAGKYCDKVIANLELINKTKLGNILISMLVRYEVDIEYLTQENCDFYPKGSGARIFYNPDFLDHKEPFDPTQGTVSKKKMSFIYLYHELLHALRWETGQFIKAQGNMFAISLPEDYTVVGLYEYVGYQLSENSYRQQLGLPRRPYYIFNKIKHPDEFEQEVKRRMFLCLPDPPKIRSEETTFNPNRFNQKINEWKLGMYIAFEYGEKRKEFPHGYPEKGPVVPQDWQGPK